MKTRLSSKVLGLCYLILMMSAVGAERTTWLIHDEEFTTPLTVCSSNCHGGGFDKAKLLPGVPVLLKEGPNYMENGYWFVVVNTLKSSKPSGCGQNGSMRIQFQGVTGRWAYYNATNPGYNNPDIKVGVANIISQKISNWRLMVDRYEKITLASDWDKPMRLFSIGPQSAALQSCTPISFRFRAYITLDPKFIPPSNPNDPVGVQPGSPTYIRNGSKSSLPLDRTSNQKLSVILFGENTLGTNQNQVFEIQGKENSSNPNNNSSNGIRIITPNK